jgi:hypothetical protein
MKHQAVVAIALFAISAPLHSPSAEGTLVARSDHTCAAQLPDGTNYEVHHRTLKARWKDRDVYVVVTAYYEPGAGEFLYYSSILSK